ncbi:MAG: hypothetical protein R3E88_10810 [Myxococcota bacterium]
MLEVVALLRRHVPDDTYRFPPATDFTGRNVYRASLLRLENIERIHAESLRAGHLDGVIAFSKARALERLRAFDVAADAYRLAAERDATLRDDALASAAACDAIAGALAHGPEPADPLAADAAVARPDDAERVTADLDERVARLRVAVEGAPAHYRAIVAEEIERADVARASWFEAMRFALPDGHLRAVAERQRVVERHAASHRALRHTIELANLYAALAREYVAAVPPESLRFDPPKLRELVDAATQLYQRVAAHDGAPEKLEASRELEAFLAFTLQVDRDRFVPD